MVKNLNLLLLSSLLLLSNTLIAEDKTPEKELKYYDVEIIVFKNDNVPHSHEFNLPTPSATPSENSLDLSNQRSIQLAQKKGFTPLKPEQLHLLEKVKGIIKSSRYSLLLHTGWRQPGIDEKDSIPVWIKGGKIYGSGYSSIDQFREIEALSRTTESRSSNTTETGSTNPNQGAKGLYELEGHITISLSRYLHTRAELILRKPAKPVELLQNSENAALLDNTNLDNFEGQVLLNYELSEKRRMRSRKLHYLDHPEFGMLVLITPYEAPPADENEPAPVTNTNPPLQITPAEE